jgi:hypothetical protein
MPGEFARAAASVIRSRWFDVPWYLAASMSALSTLAYLLLWEFDACTLHARFHVSLGRLYFAGLAALLICIPLRVLKAIVGKRPWWLLVDALVVVGVVGLFQIRLIVVPYWFCSGSR